MDTTYIATPSWIKELPALSHYFKGGTSKLPFAFEKSTPQTDTVVHFVIKRVLKRSQGYGYLRSSKVSLKDKLTKIGGKHEAGPWRRVVARVFNTDCQVCFRHKFVNIQTNIQMNNK